MRRRQAVATEVVFQPRINVTSHRVGDPYGIPDTPTRRQSDALFVPVLRQQVADWRAAGYPGASPTTVRLLAWWFTEEHLRGGVPWKYYFAQREAIETFIFCHEVSRTRRVQDLMKLTNRAPRYYAPADDLYPRYAAKMATGSGKTKVMSLAIVWSYFHKIFEPASPMATHFLLIAPNVIVYERLADDFGDGRIFKDDPCVPEEWWPEFKMQVIRRDAATPIHARGVLYLTNIHQLYLPKEDGDEDSPVSAAGDDPFAGLDLIAKFAGAKPKAKAITTVEVPLIERVASHADLLILNDEAHHVHDVDLAWYKAILDTNSRLEAAHDTGLTAVLDFSATPKDQNGRLFDHILVDYPLATAIEDGIVKRPYLGRLADAKEGVSPNASMKYRMWLDAGVQRWRDYTAKLKHTGMKPILFVMAEDTKDADEVAAYLKTLPDLRNLADGRQRVLTIHTNRKGEIKEEARTKKDREELDRLRELARTVDYADNPTQVIVSVLMLREGWDVKNVTVIVGIRAFTAKANILPEQTIGRGVRLMSPMGPNSGWDEQVDVIGTPGFERFVLGLEEEGVEFGTGDIKQPPKFVIIAVQSERRDQYDVELPRLTPALYKSADTLAGLTLDQIPVRTVAMGSYTENEVQEYLRIDAITREKKDSFKLRLPYPAVPNDIIAYWTERILRTTKFPGRFNVIAPLVREYVARVLFGGPTQWEKRTILRRLLDEEVGETLVGAFVDAINRISVIEQEPEEENAALSVATCGDFPWSGATYPGKKTVFNLIACDSALERDMAEFFDIVPDVEAYAKIVTQMRFTIEYVSTTGKLRFYRPDFVVKSAGGMYLVETKGREDADVAQKDARAAQWCADATRLTSVPWQFVKVPQDIFERTTATSFATLVAHARVVTNPVAVEALPLLDLLGTEQPILPTTDQSMAAIPEPVVTQVAVDPANELSTPPTPAIDLSQFVALSELQSLRAEMSAQKQTMLAHIEALVKRDVAPQVDPMEARIQAAEVKAWEETEAALKPIWTLLDDQSRNELVRASFLMLTPPPLLPGPIRESAPAEAVVAIARAFERELHRHVTGPLVAKLQGERSLVANGKMVNLPRNIPPTLDESERLLAQCGDLPAAKAFLERRFFHSTELWQTVPVFISKLRAVRNRAAHGDTKPVTRIEAEAVWAVVMDRKAKEMPSPFLPMLSD